MELLDSHTDKHSDLCTICNDAYTSIHTEIETGQKIFVCEDCIDAATYNFIWLCLHCGRAYLRPKKYVIDETTDEELMRAYVLCEESKVIQTLEMCHKCDASGIERYMKIPIENMDC